MSACALEGTGTDQSQLWNGVDLIVVQIEVLQPERRRERGTNEDVGPS